MIAFDDEVDERYFALEEGVQLLLARQTPVAVDLRLVLGMLHINLHLERMADYCVTIAKLVKLAPAVAPDRDVRRRLRGDGLAGGGDDQGRARLVRVARTSSRLRSLVDLDELIDRSNRRFVQHVLSFGRDPQLHEWGLRMILVSRCFERIGDHAVDIGERTAYLVTGRVPRVHGRFTSRRRAGGAKAYGGGATRSGVAPVDMRARRPSALPTNASAAIAAISTNAIAVPPGRRVSSSIAAPTAAAAGNRHHPGERGCSRQRPSGPPTAAASRRRRAPHPEIVCVVETGKP